MIATLMSLRDLGSHSSAFTESLKITPPVWPVDPSRFARDGDSIDELNTSTSVAFMDTANSIGYSIRKGASGIATYYYSVVATASRINTNITSVHTQGIFVEGPSLN